MTDSLRWIHFRTNRLSCSIVEQMASVKLFHCLNILRHNVQQACLWACALWRLFFLQTCRCSDAMRDHASKKLDFFNLLFPNRGSRTSAAFGWRGTIHPNAFLTTCLDFLTSTLLRRTRREWARCWASDQQFNAFKIWCFRERFISCRRARYNKILTLKYVCKVLNVIFSILKFLRLRSPLPMFICCKPATISTSWKHKIP